MPGPADRRRLPLLEDEDLTGEAVIEPSRLIRPVDAVAAVLAVLVVGERLPLLGWGGIALVVGCLAVLTTPTGTASKPPATTRTPEEEPGRVIEARVAG